MKKKNGSESISVVKGIRGDLKKRKILDEFKRGTVKSKLILYFSLLFLDVLAILLLSIQLNSKLSDIKTASEGSSLITIIIILSLLMGFLLVLTQRIFSRSLLFPLRRMVERMVEITESLKMGKGDFTTQIKVFKNDEIGELRGYYNRLIDLLRKMMKNVQDGSSDVFNQTVEMSDGSVELKDQTGKQQDLINETASIIGQFTTSVKLNSEKAEEVNSILKDFDEEIHEKTTLINNVTNTMDKINESSKKIDNIINVINDISFQTNLLALNAAVEAARAGEAGRGFAVVASEVRNLAQKTAESSKSISEIVQNNLEATAEGIELVKTNAEFFNSILEVSEDIVQKIAAITDSSREQSTGIEHINDIFRKLEEVIRTNNRLVEGFSNSAEGMKNRSEELHRLVDNFKVNH